MKKYIVFVLLLSTIIIPSFVIAQVSDTDPNGPVSSCVSIQNNLRYKTRDANVNGEVSTLQDFLQSQNYLNSEPTGYFGLLTFKAVKDFQKANDISPTGYVGPVTRAKIALLTCGDMIVPTSSVLIDAQIKAFMANARAQAEIYYDSHGNYSGVCSNSNDGIYLLITNAAKKLSLDNIIGATWTSFTYSASGAGLSSVCHDSANAWAAITSLKQPTITNAGWCVDSAGRSYEATSLTANTVACPQQILTTPTNTSLTLKANNYGRDAGIISISQGTPVTLSWTGTNLGVCRLYDQVSQIGQTYSYNTFSINGSYQPVGLSLSREYTFTIKCDTPAATSDAIKTFTDSVRVWISPITTYLIGDVNGDGQITCADTKMISEYTVGLINLTSTSLKAADVNGDGVVNIIDAQQLARNNNLSCVNTTSGGGGGGTNITAPTISISPSSGPVGTVVVINGTGFSGGSDNIFSFETVSPFPYGIQQTSLPSDGKPVSLTIPLTVTHTSEAYSGSTLVPTVPGQYQIVLSNKNGKSNIVPFTITSTTNNYTRLIFNPSKTNITLGESVRLSLNAYYASSCDLLEEGKKINWQSNTPFSNGISAYATVNPTKTTIYEAMCQNSPTSGAPGGGSGSMVMVVTNPSAPASVDLKINGSDGPLTISNGQGINGNWTTSGVGSCVSYIGNQEWSGVSYGVGSFSTISPGHPSYPTTFPQTFTLTCKKWTSATSGGVGESVSDSVVINSTTTTTTLSTPTLSAQTGTQCDSVSLSWTSVAGATYYKILRDGYLITTVATSYVDSSLYTPLTPSSLHTYTVSATDGTRNSPNSNAVNVTSSASCSTTGTSATSSNDPYSAGYDVTSSTPLSGTEKTVAYTYPYNPCGSLMTSYISPGSIYVGNGPVYTSSVLQCTGGTIPDTSTFRTYACKNNLANGYVQGTATFAFQCKSSVGANALDAFDSANSSSDYFITSPVSILKIGDKMKVRVDGNLNVRASAGVASKSLGAQTNGAQGVVIDGPTIINGQSWWKVDYAYGQDGWSLGRFLELLK